MTRLLLTLSALMISGQAMAAPGKCLLVVKGKTFINGPCNIDDGEQGSFRINTGEGRQPSPYFVYFNKDGKLTEASWNEDPAITHANNSLGEGFVRHGSCWENKIAKICTWRKNR